MRTADELREAEKFLEPLTQTPRVRRALSEVRAEIIALETRREYPVNSNLFYVAGPNGAIYRAEKQ